LSESAAIVEQASDAIFSQTLDGVITSWNGGAARLFGYGRSEMIGRSGRLLLAPGSVEQFERIVGRLRRGDVLLPYEADRVRKDGRRIRVSLAFSLLRNARRQPIGFSTIARDITAEYAGRADLARRQRELDRLFEEASVGLLIVSPDGTLLRVNQAFAALLDAEAEEMIGQPLQVFHPDTPSLSDLIKRLAERGRLQNVPTELQTAGGDRRFVLVDADGLWEDGQLVHSRWFVRDISRRRRLERELLEISDRERRRFAQELHDGLGQQLGGIAYLANVLRQRLDERGAPERGEATRIFHLVRKAIEDARRISRGWSPIRDEPEGLMDGLRELAAQISETSSVRCRLLCPRRILVPDTVVASHLFRIAQEAVNNAIKHGRASAVTILPRVAGGQLRLSVLDNGRGLPPIPPRRGGLGLRTMQYRAALIRGALEVRPRQQRGTEVICTLPWPKAPD
jgi:PAS domain S-box-containing protein